MERCDLMRTDFDDEQDREINQVIKEKVSVWTDEVARILQFYANKAQQRVDKIYIYGGGAKLNGLADYMQEKLDIETEKIDKFDGVEFARNISVANIDQFINTLGTVIRF